MNPLRRGTDGAEERSFMEKCMDHFLRFPSAHKSAEELTDQERIALCIFAGVKTETEMKDGKLIMRTVNPVGFQKIDGKFRVCEYVGD